MKKLLAIILAVAMICSVFVGCNNASDVEPSGNSNNTPNETASNGSDNGDTQSDVAWDTSKKDEIIVTVVNGYYTAGERALAEAYMELHPETKVTIDVVSDNDAYFAKMQAIFSGDSLDRYHFDMEIPVQCQLWIQ